MRIGRLMGTIAGFVTTYVGWAMWKEPRLDTDILVSSAVEEIGRLVNDPFAILGLIIMFVGLMTLMKSLMYDEPTKERKRSKSDLSESRY